MGVQLTECPAVWQCRRQSVTGRTEWQTLRPSAPLSTGAHAAHRHTHTVTITQAHTHTEGISKHENGRISDSSMSSKAAMTSVGGGLQVDQ